MDGRAKNDTVSDSEYAITSEVDEEETNASIAMSTSFKLQL